MTMRARFESVAEWVVAAAVLVGLFAGGLSLSGALGRVVPVTPLIAIGPTVPVPSPVVPSGAVFLSTLTLPGGQMLSVGQHSGDLERLLPDIRPVEESVERALRGERITRAYEINGRMYYVVFDERVIGLFVRN